MFAICRLLKKKPLQQHLFIYFSLMLISCYNKVVTVAACSPEVPTLTPLRLQITQLQIMNVIMV